MNIKTQVITCADDREKVAPGSAVNPSPLTSTGVKSRAGNHVIAVESLFRGH